MHELAICQELLSQVTGIAREHGATRVDQIVLSVGPLSGVEPDLLDHAFEIARCGTVAEDAVLEMKGSDLVVECRLCGNENPAEVNRLLCSACGTWQVKVKKGEEMMLLSVELSGMEKTA
jgi:hydrogenase nickel incorporation protein HypA/HybF